MVYNCHYVLKHGRNCYIKPPLGPTKPVINSRWSLKQGSLAKTCSWKVKTFLLLHFHNCHNTLVYTHILHLCSSKSTKKVVPSLHNPQDKGTCVLYCGPILQVNDFVGAKSGSHWSRSAGSCSPQKLFCTKSFMRGISVIKSRWSLNTEVVNSSFCCTCICINVRGFNFLGDACPRKLVPKRKFLRLQYAATTVYARIAD